MTRTSRYLAICVSIVCLGLLLGKPSAAQEKSDSLKHLDNAAQVLKDLGYKDLAAELHKAQMRIARGDTAQPHPKQHAGREKPEQAGAKRMRKPDFRPEDHDESAALDDANQPKSLQLRSEQQQAQQKSDLDHGRAPDARPQAPKLKGDRAQSKPVPKIAGRNATFFDGRVTNVSTPLIAINLGSDDGLEKGDDIHLMRNDRFIGSATIVTVDHNRAAAHVYHALEDIKIASGDSFIIDREHKKKGADHLYDQAPGIDRFVELDDAKREARAYRKLAEDYKSKIDMLENQIQQLKAEIDRLRQENSAAGR